MTGTQEKQIKKRDEPNRRTQFEANLEDHTRTAACLTRLLLLELMRLRTSTRSSSRASSSRSTRRLIFVVPANLPNKLLERLVDIPSGLCRCFDELTSELLGECRTLYGNAITKSGKMVSGSVVRSKSGRKLGVPCVCTCLSRSKSDLFATTMTGKKSLSLTRRICWWNVVISSKEFLEVIE